MHSTVMLGEVDHKIFQKLGVGLTCDPQRNVTKERPLNITNISKRRSPQAAPFAYICYVIS